MLERPQQEEYPEYFQTYISKVPDGDLLQYLNQQRTDMLEFINNLTPQQLSHKYAEDKWTVRQSLSHINDVERIFGFRTLACLRNDTADIPGFEQDDYVANTSMSKKTKKNLADEFQACRNANIHMIISGEDSEWMRKCKINGNDTSARSMAYMIAGHVEHHKRIFEEIYFK